jgi:16S rRNA (cytosine1402-N4)-methyltransferase
MAITRTLAYLLAGKQKIRSQSFTTATATATTTMRGIRPLMLGASFTFFSTTTTTSTSGFQPARSDARSKATFRTTRTSIRKLSSSTTTIKTTNNNDNVGDANSSSDEESFATSYHAPVMWKECIQGLLECERSKGRLQDNNNDDDDEKTTSLVFVDGTLGGGGHSAALLQQLQPGDVVIGCDVDPNALETASSRLKDYMDPENNSSPLFIPVQSNFGNLTVALEGVLHPLTGEPITKEGVDGILLDLGVSSFQINTPERGFAFMKDGPLDMRMGGSAQVTGFTAADICNEFDEGELQRIFSVYSDEPKSKTVAKAIINHRPLTTTGELVKAIASVTPKFAKSKRRGQTATFARIFQSLRIVVNNEDGVLEQVLSEVCPTLIRPGGRLVVLSYHSMEDRAAKRIMRDGTLKRIQNQQDLRDMYGNYAGPPKPFRPAGKRRKATEEEIALNSRARSASLRIAERNI